MTLPRGQGEVLVPVRGGQEGLRPECKSRLCPQGFGGDSMGPVHVGRTEDATLAVSCICFRWSLLLSEIFYMPGFVWALMSVTGIFLSWTWICRHWNWAWNWSLLLDHHRVPKKTAENLSSEGGFETSNCFHPIGSSCFNGSSCSWNWEILHVTFMPEFLVS